MAKFYQRSSVGQVLVLVAVMIVVLLGLAGLALDLGRAYGVRAKLNAAVDAASYEAARVLGQGADKGNVPAMTDKAKQVATAYFNANYPDGYLGATPKTIDVQASRNEDGSWKVAISATATMPTVFARVLGSDWQNLDIRSGAGADVKTVDMVLVIDTSGSLSGVFAPIPGSTNANVIDSAKAYVDLFNSDTDRVGLVAFSSAAKSLVQINTTAQGFDKQKVMDAIGNLKSDGRTASEEGLRLAFEQLESVDADKRSGTRAIVFFSDGAPNTINGEFPLDKGGKTKGNLFSNYNVPGMRPAEVWNQNNYPILTTASNDSIKSLPTSLKDVGGTVSMIGTRPLSGDATNAAAVQCDVVKAARNMTENVAKMARDKGIIVYTLGLGDELETPYEVPAGCDVLGTGVTQELGSAILANLATITSGVYCKADTVDQLQPCFSQLASSILRISK